MRNEHRPSWGAVILLAVASIAPGCGINRRYAHSSIRELAHSSVEVEYRVREPVAPVVPAGGATASDGGGEQSAAAPAGSQRVLSIVYPHPSPKLGRKYAQVTLRDERPAGAASSTRTPKLAGRGPLRDLVRHAVTPEPEDGSVLHMALTYDELENLLEDIIADGYFEREQRDGGVALSVAMGSRSSSKSWDHVAALDRLAERVRTAQQDLATTGGTSPHSVTMPAELLPPSPAEDDAHGAAVWDETATLPDPAKF